MAITTLAGILTGLQPPVPFSKAQTGSDGNIGVIQDYWAYAGTPASGSFDTTLNGVTLSSTSAQVTGQLRFTDPASGSAYLAKFSCNACNATQTTDVRGTVMLCDRLWHNGNIDSTSLLAQNITTPTWPARDAAGATSGDGVFIGLEASVGTNVAPGATTISYTNSAGTAGRSGSLITSSSRQRKSVFEIGLQAGDTGVQSVQSITLASAPGSITYNLFAYRVIAQLSIKIANKTYEEDAVKLGFPKTYNGSVPFIMFRPDAIASGGIISQLTGRVTYAWG